MSTGVGGAVFDHSGLCISRGADYGTDEALQRASAACILLQRCAMLAAKTAPAGGSSLVASLNEAPPVQSPYLPRNRSGNLSRPVVYEASNLGSSVGNETTTTLMGSHYALPICVIIETSSETVYAVASDSHVSVFRVAPGAALPSSPNNNSTSVAV
jgi:hypothetical protein